jgi:hypothetical protein
MQALEELNGPGILFHFLLRVNLCGLMNGTLMSQAFMATVVLQL